MTRSCNLNCAHCYMDSDAGRYSNEVLHKLRALDYKEKCGSCNFKKLCGGCRARAAFQPGGDYMAEEPWCLYPGNGREGDF